MNQSIAREMTKTIFNIPDSQLSKVWDRIDGLQPDETLTVSNEAPKRPEEFIQACKMWIDFFKDAEFNMDYTILRKTDHSSFFKNRH